MESYLLKSSLSLMILYGLYRIMRRYEFNHQLNRFVGLTCILFSISFPFVDLKELTQANVLHGTLEVLARGTVDFQKNVSSAISIDSTSVFLTLYVFGVGIFLLRYVVGLGTLLWLFIQSPKSYKRGFTVVSINRSLSPFSFFNILFIAHDHFEDWETMLLHEQVHRDQYHSIDAVLLEALGVIFWFNPAMWFFKRDIKAEHEYLADQRVLERGIALIDYQLILFKTRTGTSLELGNYLSNKTSLIKRFNMMTQTKSNAKGSFLRASLFLIPMSVIILLSAFSGRIESHQVDKIATYGQGEEAMYKDIIKEITYPASARNDNRSGVVRVSFTVTENGNVTNVEAETDKEGYLLNEIVVIGHFRSSQKEKGIDESLKASSVRAVKTIGKFNPAQKDGKPVSSVLTIPIKFTLEKN